MPNTANINDLIEHLRALPPEEFSMRAPCMCLIGQAARISGEDFRDVGTYDYLGLSSLDGTRVETSLVMPHGWEDEPDGGLLYPIPVVIRMLEIARDENTVDWGRARREVEEASQ